MSAESHAELQKWFDENKFTPAFMLAVKHRNTMSAEAVARYLAAYPDESADGNERELALLFALTIAAEKVDLPALVLANLPAVPVAPKAPPFVPASHVDVVPLEKP